MSRRRRRDLMADHREWAEHTYNTPYWINRISLPALSWWRWVRQHHRLVGGVEAFTGGVVLLAAWPARWDLPAVLALLLPALMLAAGLVLFVRQPYGASGAVERKSRKQRARGKRR